MCAQDGPAGSGRHHKAWVLVSKNHSTARNSPVCAVQSNLEAVPALSRYAHNCQELWDPSGSSCKPWMMPGDVLFFREDVWHKTQDVSIDRLSFIVHIFRVPLRSTPLHMLTHGG